MTYDKITISGYEKDFPQFSEAVYTRCIITCGLGRQRDPKDRVLLENVVFKGCKFNEVSCAGIHFKGVVFEDCHFQSINHFDACLFENVSFKGKFSGTFINNYLWNTALPCEKGVNLAFLEANSLAYAEIESAVDMSECVPDGRAYTELVLAGVPACKVRTGDNVSVITIDYEKMKWLHDEGRAGAFSFNIEVLVSIYCQDFVYFYSENRESDVEFVGFCRQNGLAN